MHFESHATLGWILANTSGADRRLRKYCVLASIIPDIDAASFFGGIETYAKYHHTFGHNIFFGTAFVLFATYRCRSRKALIITSLAFASHLITDAIMTKWELYLFWPFSGKGYIFSSSYNLGHPLNTYFVSLSFFLIFLLAYIYKRTPIDILSQELDQHIISFFRKKTSNCFICGSKCNNVCFSCEKDICSKHSYLSMKLKIQCKECYRDFNS